MGEIDRTIGEAYFNLAVAIIGKAYTDSQRKNDRRRLRALGWLFTEAPAWLERMNFDDYMINRFMTLVIRSSKNG